MVDMETKVAQVVDFISSIEDQTQPIKDMYKLNYDQFVHGSDFPDKDDWMSQITLGLYSSRIRAVVSAAKDILVNDPEWFNVEPANRQNQLSERLSPVIKKTMDYYLRRGRFTRYAGVSLTNALLGFSPLFVGWKNDLIQNPKAVLQKTEKQVQAERKRLSETAENVAEVSEIEESELIQKSFDNASSSFKSLVEGLSEPKAEPEHKPHIAIGVLDFRNPLPDHFYWETNPTFINDSKRNVHEEFMYDHQVVQLAQQGFFDADAIDEAGNPRTSNADLSNERLRYKQIHTSEHENLRRLTYYFGVLMDDEGKVVKDNWACILLDRAVVIKEWDTQPFWNPPGHEPNNPYVHAVIKEIPYNQVGAGAGVKLAQLSKAVDSDINLARDSMRMNMCGINVVDTHRIVEPDELMEGVEPGKTIHVTGDTKKAFTHINTSSNLERQFDPIGGQLRGAIDEQTGANNMDMGQLAPKSRTTAREISAAQAGKDSSIRSIATELEQSFLLPVLQICLARILQYGFEEIFSNPELSALLTDEEKDLILGLTREERLNMLNQFFTFKIKGFTARFERDEKLSRLNEMISIIAGGGPLSQIVNIRPLIAEWVRLQELDENLPDVIMPEGELDKIRLENNLLQMGSMIQPNPQEDHNLHLQNHAQVLNPSPQMMQHMQMHQMAAQQIMMAQQESQDLNQPIEQ